MSDKEKDKNEYDELIRLSQLLQKHYENELKHSGELTPAIRVINSAQKMIQEEEKRLDSYEYDYIGRRK